MENFSKYCYCCMITTQEKHRWQFLVPLSLLQSPGPITHFPLLFLNVVISSFPSFSHKHTWSSAQLWLFHVLFKFSNLDFIGFFYLFFLNLPFSSSVLHLLPFFVNPSSFHSFISLPHEISLRLICEQTDKEQWYRLYLASHSLSWMHKHTDIHT